MRNFGIGATARAVGLLAIGAAIVVTDVHLRQGNANPVGRLDLGATAQADSFARKLAHCQAIGMAAEDDAACEVAWAANRRRFFAPLVNHQQAPMPHSDARQPR